MTKNKLPILLILSVFFVFSCGSNQKIEQPPQAGTPIQENTPAQAGAPRQETPVRQETTPKTEEVTVLIDEKPVQVQVDEETFDPSTVTQEYYDYTMEEVQHFIEELNGIIRSRNYNLWRAALSDDYFYEISSPRNLEQLTEQPAMKTRKIVLRTARDYFTYVVVPSRANSRVDAIEFISKNRVKAFTIITNRAGEEQQRLRLYDLEKIDDIWKIIN